MQMDTAKAIKMARLNRRITLTKMLSYANAYPFEGAIDIMKNKAKRSAKQLWSYVINAIAI